MNKKILTLLSTTITASICLGVVMVAVHHQELMASGNLIYEMSLNSKSQVKEKEAGYLHQIEIKNNDFDLVGYSTTGGSLGSIKQATYGDYTYKGMIYNRSVINGLKSLTVKFSGGDLYYVFTNFLMENMEFDKANQLVNETLVSVPNNECYFIVYTDSETGVDIDYVNVKYECDNSIDREMMYHKDASLGGARSWTSKVKMEDSYLEMENNPTKTTNNYSHGNNVSTAHDNSWYRFNGRYFKEYGDLGTEFTFAMTIGGEYNRMVDESKYFNYEVWPQLTYEGAPSSDEQWIQAYIGNDNYEPLGAEHTIQKEGYRYSDTYTGRFFGDFNTLDEGATWEFMDPDTFKTPDDSLTLREAYERYNLPFWFIKFHVYLDEENDPMYDIYINNMLVYRYWCFENYDKVNTPSIGIKTIPMHIINYGVDSDGNPAESYKGIFTYPRLVIG